MDICEDLVDEREKSVSSDDDVAHMQVTISLTLGRAGLVKAEVREVKAEEAFEVDNTVKGVAAGERRAALDRREGGEKGPTMIEKTWQDERRAACETGSRCIEEGPERSQSDGSSRDGALQSPAEEDTMRRRQVDNTARRTF